MEAQMKRKFKIDHRENKGLHALYVSYAIKGLLAIDRAICLIDAEGQTSHASILLAMLKERAKLIRDDSAYAEADEFLQRLAAKGHITYPRSTSTKAQDKR